MAPKVLRDLYRSRKRSQPTTWQGTYRTFSEVPRSGPAFEGGIWLEKMLRSTEEIRALARDSRTALGIVTGEYAVLPLLVATIATTPLTILDFGGGLGRDYLSLKVAVDGVRVQYHIVEVAPLCEKGRDLHRDDDAIRFHTELPPLEHVDIVNLHSSLQFVEDWRALLAKVVAYHPRHVLFIHLPAGNVATFATAQRNVEGSFIPCWFFALSDITDEMRARGYELAYCGTMERSYDMRNFPPGSRLTHPCNLLFTRTAAWPA